MSAVGGRPKGDSVGKQEITSCPRCGAAWREWTTGWRWVAAGTCGHGLLESDGHEAATLGPGDRPLLARMADLQRQLVFLVCAAICIDLVGTLAVASDTKLAVELLASIVLLACCWPGLRLAMLVHGPRGGVWYWLLTPAAGLWLAMSVTNALRRHGLKPGLFGIAPSRILEGSR